MAEPFFQLRPFAGTVWPALPDANLSLVWHAYRELDRSQWLTPAAIEEGQVAQLRHLLTHCKATVPYYRQSLRGCDPLQVHTLADFRRLPILERRSNCRRGCNWGRRSPPRGRAASASRCGRPT
jgi:hypothetical protein